MPKRKTKLPADAENANVEIDTVSKGTPPEAETSANDLTVAEAHDGASAEPKKRPRRTSRAAQQAAAPEEIETVVPPTRSRSRLSRTTETSVEGLEAAMAAQPNATAQRKRGARGGSANVEREEEVKDEGEAACAEEDEVQPKKKERKKSGAKGSAGGGKKGVKGAPAAAEPQETSGSQNHDSQASDMSTASMHESAPENVPYGAVSDGIKIVSWNVNGIRAITRDKSHFVDYVDKESPHILCVQETKVDDKSCPRGLLQAKGYDELWTFSTTKAGYSGVAVFTRIKPVAVTYGLQMKEHDGEGRLITVEFDKFYLVATYVPNAGEKLDRLAYRTEEWDSDLRKYLTDLKTVKPVVLTGDLNVAHNEIDIHSPKTNRRSAGFTDEERSSFGRLLEAGFVDTYRRQYPDKAHRYSYWGYRFNARARNKGWRLDYFVVSADVAPAVKESFIRSEVLGSDHCPVGIILAL